MPDVKVNFYFIIFSLCCHHNNVIEHQLLISIQGFIDNDIRNDVECAKLIFAQDGFKAWQGWIRHCKGKPLPNLSNCNLLH